MRRAARFAAVCVCLFALSAGADDSFVSDSGNTGGTASFDGPIALPRAVSRALSESREARIARLERGRAQDALDASRGAYWPQLSVSAQAGYSNRQNERFTALDENFEPRTYGLDNLANDPWLSVVFDQVLLDMQQWRELERDELAAQIAEVTQREHAERVAFDVTRHFALLERARRREHAAREQLDAAVWLDEHADRLGDAGRVLGGERERVSIEREASELDLRDANARVAAARSALWLAIQGGSEPEPWPGIVSASLPQPPAADGVGADPPDEAFANAPDLRILALQRELYEVAIAAAKAGRYPTLNLRGGYAHYGIKRFDNFKDEAYVFVGIEVPVFDGFQSASRIAGARKDARVARLEYHTALDGKRLRVRDLQRRLAIASDRLPLAERRVAASLEAQQLADRLLESQRGDVDGALSARQSTLRERETLADLRFERVELWATLQREMGRLAATLVSSKAASGERGPGE